jgi:hypothetical protein
MKKNKTTSIALVVAFAFLISCNDDVSNETPRQLKESANLTNGSVPPPAKSTVGDYTLTGKESDPISLETAKQWTANYRRQNPGEREAHFFGFEMIKLILAEKNCMGIRMYYALDEKGQKQLILVGVDAKGENLLPTTLKLNAARTESGKENAVADASFPCPGTCANSTSL